MIRIHPRPLDPKLRRFELPRVTELARRWDALQEQVPVAAAPRARTLDARGRDRQLSLMAPTDSNAHAVHAARMDTRDLEERLRRMAREQDATRAAIEAELRREHLGRIPDGWHATADGTVDSKP